MFASWFNRGFLELRRIDWNTPAAVLEKLLVYEAVHEIQGYLAEVSRLCTACGAHYFTIDTRTPLLEALAKRANLF